MATFDPYSAAASIFGSAIGGIGSANAANAQEAAARQAQNAARRNFLMQTAINEPLRNTGYQALSDINNFFGYSTPNYTTANQLASSMNPLTAKQVKQALKGGATFDQIAQMGTLGTGNKSIKRLMKAGLTMDQITQLRNGVAQNASQGGGTGAPSQNPGGGQNFDAIWNAPDIQFQYQQGTKNAGNSFAARGGAASGNALRELSRFNQGLASQGVDNFLNRRMNLMNFGERAINNVGNAGSNYSRDYQQAQQQMGDARASGILGVTGAIQGGLSGLAGSFGGAGGGNSLSAFRNYGNGGYQVDPRNYQVNPQMNWSQYSAPSYNLGV